MDAQAFAKVCEEFLADPEVFGYEAFADLLCDFANDASQSELQALAMCMITKKA